VRAVGIKRIEYRPWKGERSDPKWRFLVISKSLLRRSLKAKSVIIVLIAGILLAHVFNIIFAIIVPHEALTNEDMIGTESSGPYVPPPFNSTINTTGNLSVDGSLLINGTFMVMGNITVNGTLMLSGSVEGAGSLNVTGQGLAQYGNLSFVGMMAGIASFGVNGSIVGTGTLNGDGHLNGTGSVTGTVTGGPDEQKNPDVTRGSSGYLTSGLLVLFTILLAAIVCSDVIADDLADSSFVLYFSRPVRSVEYLVGKFTGLAWVMGLFCVVMPVIYALVMLGTQTGNDYGGGLEILGKTLLVGILTAVFFLPYGLLLSSITNRKAYAGIGIFASFFVLSIIGEAFSRFDVTWNLIDPMNMLLYTYRLTFGGSMPDGLSSGQLAAAMLLITMVPMAIVYYLIDRKGAGK
jgi:ABC-type transport system involved in multi-copper enzyme maturation permease subunit